MEENQNQVMTQTNTVAVSSNKNDNKNVFTMLILVALFITFGILIYAIKTANEADYLSVLKPTNFLNPVPVKPVNLPLQGQVEGTDSVDIGDIDAELQDLNIDVQGL